MNRLTPDAFRAGDAAIFAGANPEPVTIVRAEQIAGDRWLHVRFEDGSRIVTHPTHLARVPSLSKVLREHVAAVEAARSAA